MEGAVEIDYYSKNEIEGGLHFYTFKGLLQEPSKSLIASGW